ncbi:hypothetical protein D9619_002635 [Psilocybe cf. subviscida]|uniref:Uncharacterized protein n=1 Tax=Psilocybe cf. subviscida TaxID=2480587 RepID=A0A8H5EU49_9AGAR|nr:hypothetical protein D9619_002635 [Psilocybe cf. subviscida]
MTHATLSEDLGYMSSSNSGPLLHTAMSTECLTQSPPPVFIRFLAQIMTGLHFLESVGTTFILWLCPSLAPEPRVHQYISPTPGGQHYHHEQRRLSLLTDSPNAVTHTSSANNPRRRNSRLRISSAQKYDCFLDRPDSPRFAEQRKEILAIFEQHKDGDETGRTAL